MKNNLIDQMYRLGTKNLNEGIKFPVNIEDIENGAVGTLRKNDDGSITIQFPKGNIVFKNNKYVTGTELGM
tara:strand:- start:7562 stop:7774 length:213 start_codon:yes stop_codon:yes gene_type:complete